MDKESSSSVWTSLDFGKSKMYVSLHVHRHTWHKACVHTKERLQTNNPYEYRCKNLNETLANKIKQIVKGLNTMNKRDSSQEFKGG